MLHNLLSISVTNSFLCNRGLLQNKHGKKKFNLFATHTHTQLCVVKCNYCVINGKLRARGIFNSQELRKKRAREEIKDNKGASYKKKNKKKRR